MNTKMLLRLIAASTLLTSCDDGYIQEEVQHWSEGKTVTVEGRISGLDSWPDKYSVALAGFDGTNRYAVISKVVSPTGVGPDGHFRISMSGISDNVTQVEVCVINRLRQRVITLTSMPLEAEGRTTEMQVGELDAEMYHLIQSQFFDVSCTACHGASTFSAAGLNLTEGNSYSHLVNVESAKVPGMLLVAPGDAEASVLHQVLNTDLTATWRQNHSDMLNKERTAPLLSLIDDWITHEKKE